jgi:single-strand DNA-binding protein
MSGVNKVILVGRLGKDPEVRNLENGAAVANFSIATSETYKDRTTGEKKEITEWHNIVAWRGLADITQKYLRKGDMVYIEGKLRTRSWEKDGVTRYTTEIVADNMNMLTPRTSGGGNAPNNGGGYGGGYSNDAPTENRMAAPTMDTSTDDLPF